MQVALVAIQLPDVKSDVVLTLYTPLFINPKSAAAEHTGKLRAWLHAHSPYPHESMHYVMLSPETYRGDM